MKCGKKYLLGLLLFSVPLVLFSLSQTDPGEMSKAEIIAELQTISEERAAELTQREQRAAEREAELTERENALAMKIESLTQREAALTALMNYWMSFASVIKQEKNDSYWAGFLNGISWGVVIGATGSMAVFISIPSG